MAVSKNLSFEADFVTLSNIAKALSHPARLEIIKILAEQNMCICGEIVEVMPLSQSTVSQHLKELKKVGLIKGTIDGVRSCYCVDWDKLRQAKVFFEDFFQLVESNQKSSEDCC